MKRVLLLIAVAGGAAALLSTVVLDPAAVGVPGAAAPPDHAPDRRASEIALELTDYDFVLSRPLTAGTHRIRVRTAASQAHEILIFRLAPGRSVRDVVAYADARPGPAPGEMVGASGPIGPGREKVIEVTLATGRYALVCFIPDATDGRPHFEHGMMTEIEIR